MEMFIVFLLVPVVGGLIAKYYWHETFTWQEFGGSILITAVAISAVYFSSLHFQTMDQEIINGEITGKSRDHATYLEAYSCNCRTITHRSGDSTYTTQSCDTCYRRHYTVTWSASSTVGKIVFDHLDSTSSGVYSSPDPKPYTDCYIGEPASQPNGFTNYIKAVPDSLFNNQNTKQFENKIPSYPKIHSHYKVDRIINVHSSANKDELSKLDTLFDEMLKSLGPRKQANIIAIFTNITDPMYRYAVEGKWLGGKKNDVVLFFGTDGDTIAWTDVMTWALNSGNELFVSDLKSKLMDIKQVNAEQIAAIVGDSISKGYIRPKMEDFEYLKDDIRPPFAVVVICWILSIFGSIALSWYFHRHIGIESHVRMRYNRFAKTSVKLNIPWRK